MSARTKKLSSGAKIRALLMAGDIKAKADHPVGHVNGYVSDFARAEMLEIADLLSAAGQPHAGKPDRGRAYHAISVMKQTGWTVRKAARFVLAYVQWSDEYAAATTEAEKIALEAESRAGLIDRMKDVEGVALTRLVAKIKATRADPNGLKVT